VSGDGNKELKKLLKSEIV